MSGSDPALGYVEGRGYYDWAGRRLFLNDGAPDPNTPGAYRYRFDPDSCDPTAPESDPANPRYEPPHLRHRPGDTWKIGGKPADPDAPGPYGSRGWYQDTRTGRHRRNELPDPPKPEVDTRESGPQPYRFDRLREDAWDHFMSDSAPLAAAHTEETRPRPRPRRQTAFEREAGLALVMWIRLARRLFALIRSLTAGAGPGTAACPGAEPDSTSGHVRPPAARKRRSRLARLRTGKEQTCAANTGQGSVLSGSAAAPQPGAWPGPDRNLRTRHGAAADRPARATAMARAIAGAQCARAGVAAWA